MCYDHKVPMGKNKSYYLKKVCSRSHANKPTNKGRTRKVKNWVSTDLAQFWLTQRALRLSWRRLLRCQGFRCHGYQWRLGTRWFRREWWPRATPGRRWGKLRRRKWPPDHWWWAQWRHREKEERRPRTKKRRTEHLNEWKRIDNEIESMWEDRLLDLTKY